MELWIDAQLPPSLAIALGRIQAVRARHVMELGLLGAKDEVIFRAAREADAIVVTKDSDFVRLLERWGPPPRILWITRGNASNAELRRLLQKHWSYVIAHFESGEPLVEVGTSP